jgi:hypothetical protein
MILAELPSRESLRTNDSTSSGVYLTHDGVFLLIGRVDPDLPRLLVYSLAVDAPSDLEIRLSL